MRRRGVKSEHGKQNQRRPGIKFRLRKINGGLVSLSTGIIKSQRFPGASVKIITPRTCHIPYFCHKTRFINLPSMRTSESTFSFLCELFTQLQFLLIGLRVYIRYFVT